MEIDKETYDKDLQYAEEHLVGCAIRDLTVRAVAQVSEEQFFSPALRAIWGALGELGDYEGEVELGVCEQLGAGAEAVGGLAYVAELGLGVLDPSVHESYAKVVRDRYLSRTVRSKCAEIAEDCHSSGEDLLESLSSASASLLGSLGRVRRTLADVVAQEHLKASEGTGGVLGIPTGLGVERWIPGGLPRSKITTIFADTGSFKTTLINQVMFHMAENGYRGMLFPLEDSDELNAQRYLSRKSGIAYGKIAGGVLSDAERQLVAKVKPGEWDCLRNIVSLDGIEPRIDRIIREVAACHARDGLDFVVVDYIQLIEGYGNQKDVLTDAMRKAANCAKRYNLCWIFISQQNEKADDRGEPRPSLKDMFGSSAMKQMSKTVFALFRPYEIWPDPTGNNNHPHYGLYSKMFDRNERLMSNVYKNLIELWMLKNVLGKKKAMMHLVAKPEVGILDPIILKEAMR